MSNTTCHLSCTSIPYCKYRTLRENLSPLSVFMIVYSLLYVIVNIGL
jgi:hypothetical protein